jgi:MFS transporter, DHA3 family, macrolide efflux protein
MRVFVTIWLGQLLSSVGSGLTNFAFAIWVYRHTGSATQFALVALFGTVPSILLSPLAGVLADRWRRRATMLFSVVGCAASTLVIVVLLFAGRLEIWHIYVFVSIRAGFSSFMGPAFSAATAMLVPKAHFGRASGMMQASQATSQILAPLLAGALMVVTTIENLVLIDFASYFFAIVALLIVQIPEPVRSADATGTKRSLLRDALYGWTYVRERSGLVGLLIYFAIINFIVGIATVLLAPMVLSFTNAQALGVILSVGGAGFLAGSIVMSVWGGPKVQVRGVLAFGALLGFCVMLVGMHASVPLVAVALCGIYLSVPLINGCNQAIWQSKTAPELQGRVFALRRMVAWIVTPFAYLIAGPLADKVFQPLLNPAGALSSSVGRFTGVGPGRGIGLMFIVSGALTMLVPLGAYLYPRLRLVEFELPDTTADEALSKA